MKTYYTLVIILLLNKIAFSQPVGGEISFYFTDKDGNSIFNHTDSLIAFDNIYQNKKYKMVVAGKDKNYTIYFDKNTQPYSCAGYEVNNKEGVFSVSFFSVDSFTISITDTRTPKNTLTISFPYISEGKPYIINTMFRRKRFKIRREQIDKLKKEQSEIGHCIDLSSLLK